VDERAVVAFGVGKDFLLDDDGSFVAMDEFDGILNGDDLAAALAVDEIDHVVEGGCLAGAGGAGDEDEAVGAAGEFVDLGGESKIFAGGNAISAEADG
jgi:hypothetical protein